MTTRPKVYIVDDDLAVQDSLSEMIRAMGLQPLCYGDADRFLAELDWNGPGCIVLDVRLPGRNGIEIHEQLAARGNSPPVIMITGHGDVASGVRAMKMGAIEFFEKPFSPQKLREAILEAVEIDARRRRERARRADVSTLLKQLTSQEREVADMVVLGYTNKEIASRLDVSLRTVQLRRSSIMKKLKIKSRPQLVKLMLPENSSRDQTDAR
jgi:FixJ family two-component response regulator